MSRTTPPTRRIYISSFSHQREEKTKKFYSHQDSTNRVMDTYHPIPQIFQKHVELTIYLPSSIWLQHCIWYVWPRLLYVIIIIIVLCAAVVVCTIPPRVHFSPKAKKRGAYDGHGGSAAFSIRRGGHTLTVEQIASSCCPGGSWKRRERTRIKMDDLSYDPALMGFHNQLPIAADFTEWIVSSTPFLSISPSI